MPVAYFFDDQPPEQTKYATEASHQGTEFLTSPESFRLNTAFPRIKDSKVRQAIIDLLRAMGDEQEESEYGTPTAVPQSLQDHSS